MRFDRNIQRIAGLQNIPTILIQEATAKLIPLYLLFEQKADAEGYCNLSDQELANLLGISRSAVYRKRERLFEMGLVHYQAENKRKTCVWHVRAAQFAARGDLLAAQEIISCATGKDSQKVIEALRKPSAASDGVASGEKVYDRAERNWRSPGQDSMLQMIRNRYPSDKLMDLPPNQRPAAINDWKFNHVCDLLWLFSHEITPIIYKRYQNAIARGLQPKIDKHARAYVMNDYAELRYILNLAEYLNPMNPGYAKPVIPRKQTASTKTGLSTEATKAKIIQQMNTEKRRF